MEAAKLDSSRIGQRRSRRDAAVLAWFWTVVSGAGSFGFHRTKRFAWLRAGWTSCGRTFGVAYNIRVCGRGCVSKIADSMDVVVGNWRNGVRLGRLDFSACARHLLRQHRLSAHK